MANEYVTQRDGAYYLQGDVRVSLGSIVAGFKEGHSPEAIHEDFPDLSLSQIYGAIAYYLDHQSEIDKHMADSAREFEAGGVPLAKANPVLWDKIQRAKATKLAR